MEIPRHWKLKAERYRPEGVACPICHQPPTQLSTPQGLSGLRLSIGEDAGWELPEVTASMNPHESESRMTYAITESFIG